MRHFWSASGSCVILSLILVNQFVEAAGFRWSSCSNRTKVFSRRTRGTETPTPIDCKLKSWTPWTRCDSCTDKTKRFQYVERLSQFGGTPCVHSQWDVKLCPPMGECDPQDDCGDMYACPETGRCISQQLRCNGDWDCMFGSDEDDCEEIKSLETKCVGMLPIPGAQKATQGYNALSDVQVNPVLDHNYFGGICDYIYNGEWRELTYDSFCEHLHYSEDEKYFRKPYNFLSYRMLAHSLSQGSIDEYSDIESLLQARQIERSSSLGFSFGIQYVEAGIKGSHAEKYLTNITQYDSKEVLFIRLLSTVETAQFKMRSRDLMLHEDLLQSLMELPEQYDFGAYSHFITEYGTHYITEGVMGGILDYTVVVDKKEMEKQKIEGHDVKNCIGFSLGLSKSFTSEVSGKLTAAVDHCKTTGSFKREKEGESPLIKDVIGFVKGGITGPSAAKLVVHNAESYRAWGKSLKYNPVVIKFETLPIYELVRSSTAAAQARTRVPLLKQAWGEYMAQFNPCRCAPCMNNGMPVLTRTSCSCLCKTGYYGLACEKSERTPGPSHGSWSCWTSWSSCMSGTKTRTRQCNNPPPKDSGFPCRGNPLQKERC